MAALEQAADANSDGTVVLTDLGSAVMTAESAAGIRGRSLRPCCWPTRPWSKGSSPPPWPPRPEPTPRA